MFRLGKPWTTHETPRDLDSLAVVIREARAAGGVTLRGDTLAVVTNAHGFAVSAAGGELRINARDELSRDLAAAVLAYHAAGGRDIDPAFDCIGLWFDGEDLVLDRTRIVYSLRRAIEIAVENRQDALYSFADKRAFNTAELTAGFGINRRHQASE